MPASLFEAGRGGPVEASGVAGSFTFSHSAGTVLNAGSTTLTATFNPTDTATYASTTCTTNLTIQPAALTCTGKTYSRYYGEANPSLGFTCSGFVNGDSMGVVSSSGSFLAGPAADASPGSYTVGFQSNPSAGSNYTVTTTGATVTVAKRPVTCVADDKSMMLNGAAPTLSQTCSGLALGESQTIFGTAPLKIDGTTTAIGTAPIVYMAPVTHTNYQVTTKPGVLTVTGKTPTSCSWAAAGTITYGTGVPADLFTTKGATETSGIAGSFTYSHSGGQILNAGATTMTATFVPANTTTYQGSTCTSVINVTPAALTCTGDTLSREYGAANPTIGYSCTGFKGSDTVTSLPTAGTFQAGPATNAAPGTYSVAFQTPPSGNTNYSITTAPATITVTKKAATCKADNKSMYVGSAIPTLTHTCSGLALSDTQAIFGTPQLVVNGATDRAGTQGIIYLSGITHANYTVTTTTGVMTISDQVATSCSWAAAGTITYGTGLSAALFDSTKLGAKETSGVPGTFSYTHAAGNILPAGTTVMTATFKPTDTSKYKGATCTSSVVVKPAALSCAGGTYTRAYGEANPTFSSSCTGWVGGDTVSSLTSAGTLAAGPAIDAAPGSYSVAYTTAPSAGTNYTITTSPASLEVVKKAVTCVADNKTMTVNTTPPQLTHTCTGLVLSQAQTILGTPALTINAPTTTVGTPSIIYTAPITHVNYTVTTQPGTMTVTGKTATACSWAAAGTITYGTGLAAALFDSAQSGAKETSGIAGTFSYSHSAGQKLNAGTTTMTATFNPTDATKYERSTCTSSITVNPLAVTCTGGTYTRPYGDSNPTFAYTCKDPLTGTDYTSQMTTQGVFNAGPATTAPAGTAYAVGYATQPSAGANYSVTAKPANITIQRKTVNCQVTSLTRPYGQPNPTFTTSMFTCTGFVSPDTQSSIFGNTIPTTNATITSPPSNAYQITVAAPTMQNYLPTIWNGSLTVTPAPITCTGSTHTRVYGAANPSLSYVCRDSTGNNVTSLITTPGVFAAGPAVTAGPATYDVGFSTAPSAGTNYSVATVPAKITVEKKPVTCTVADASRLTGQANPAFTFSCTGFVSPDTQSSVFGTTVPTTTATTASAAGTYPITLAAPTTGNYAVTVTNGTLTVTAAAVPVTCTGSAHSRAYGTANPTLSYSCKDANGTEVKSNLTAGTFQAGPATTAAAGATYDVAFATVPTGTGYTVTTAPAKITVTKASSTCSISPDALNAGQGIFYAKFNPTMSPSGVMSYYFSADGTRITEGTVLAGGSYGIRADLAPTDSVNYNASSCTGTLVVNKAVTCATVPLKLSTSKTYNETFVRSGFSVSADVILGGTWTFTVGGAPISYASRPASQITVSGTFQPTNAGYSPVTCSTTVTPVQCTTSTVATDCTADDGNACTINACNAIGQCINRYKGASGSLSPVVTLTCPNTLRIDFNDVLACVDPADSTAIYRIGVDSTSMLSWPSSPGYLVNMNSTIVPRSACSAGKCSYTTTSIASTNFVSGKTIFGNVAAFAGNYLFAQQMASKAGSCSTTTPICGGKTCPAGTTLNTTTCNCDPTCGNGKLDAGETCDIGNGASAGCQPGAKCIGCQLDYSSGGCRTLVGTKCEHGDANGDVTCTITTAWGPSAIVTDLSGVETDCTDDNCCPANGTDSSTVTKAFGAWNCMPFSSACPLNKGMLTDPSGFGYSHSPTTVWNATTEQNEIGFKYRCISPGDFGCQ